MGDFLDFNEDFGLNIDPIKFSITTCTKICDALDNDDDSCLIANHTQEHADEVVEIDVVAQKEEYLEILELNLGRIEEEEEYELCGRVVKWINKLKEDGKS